MNTPLVVLSVAGTDSGGAAGLAADLATFASLGVHGACVVAAVTAQGTTGVHAVETLPPAMIGEQIDAVLEDLPVAAIKTGMLGSPQAVRIVAERVARWRERAGESPAARPLVVDPVVRATSGALLADRAVVDAYREHLLPVATVITPNGAEARMLLGGETGSHAELALALAATGPAVVLTGGPDADVSETLCTDWVAQGGTVTPLAHPAIDTRNDHGTGCTFSAALAVRLARGDDLVNAARRAAAFTTSRLALSRRWNLGRGRGPIAHLTPQEK